MTLDEFTATAKQHGLYMTEVQWDSYGEFWSAFGDGDLGIFYRPEGAQFDDEGFGPTHAPDDGDRAIIVHSDDGQPWRDDGTTWTLEDALREVSERNA